ncbi:D-alanyl-D-alanine carboxypeptidase family protein [Pontibacillus litoralis]|uniref:D-alanyl-D-alanine carboxypeptidase n=1 Tax=Pontibacillus litoralis JSM 072002 TaxID=1385512 RepID=A0A0A5HT92_9BACI|nr:D-alanyl-D-alanine carboxypeptidase family protein [Pontibacillus litoralis]KGX86852.1 D-alanyl-D-alanine carboxypeptidase [Pontibacillus litoralis JSM 072002]
MQKIRTIFVLFGCLFFVYGTTVSAEEKKTQQIDSIISSEAAVLMDAKSGQILYSKKGEKLMYPASLTKIATAIYAIENGNLQDVVTVSDHLKEVEGSKVYLEAGEQLTLNKLLHGLLINSANDAGVAIAEHLHGSVEAFAHELNTYLQDEIGVKHTSFKNPHGLFEEDHQTTAVDLAKITEYAMENETFREIIGTKQYEWTNQQWETTLYTHHRMLRESPYDGVTGGKTGFIDEAGVTLETTAERDGLSLIVITLNSDTQKEAYEDTRNLLDYGFNNFETKRIKEGTIFESPFQQWNSPKDLYFTVRKNSQYTTDVQYGILNIYAMQNEPIASFPLHYRYETDNKHHSNMVRNEIISLIAFH